MKTKHLVLVLALSAFAAVACSKKSDDAAKASPSPREPEPTAAAAGGGPIDMNQAQSIFNERCSACHGPGGDGNGPAAANLNPKPRNYHDKAWQASVSDEQIKKAITLGGAAVGKSPIMPASPDLDAKPEVVDGLVKIIRKFGS